MAADTKLLLQRVNTLLSERSPWDTLWRQLAMVFRPLGYRDGNNSSSFKYKELYNKKLIKSTGIIAARTLAAGMQGGMTSPARPWFNLRLDNFEGSESHELRAWLDECVSRMRNIFQSSNFYQSMTQLYMSLGVFGTACMYEEADMDGFNFTVLPVGTYVLDVNDKGQVDTVIRKTWMNIRQLTEKFGKENLPYALKAQIAINDNQKYSTKQYCVYHSIRKREVTTRVLKANTINAMERPWESVYFMEQSSFNNNGKPHLLRESGYAYMPFFGVRWDVESGDIYGTSPAMDALPDTNMIQRVAKDTYIGIHKQVNPPVNAPSELQGIGVDLTAGGVNWISSALQGGAMVTPTLNVTPDVNAAVLLMDKTDLSIRELMYNDLFRMLIGSDRRQITATEIVSKEQEKLILITPVVERLHNELFNPLIKQTFDNMFKYNALPPMPVDFDPSKVKVEFVSTLAQAAKIISTGSIEQGLSFAGNIAQINPEVLDKINFDEAVDKYFESLGVDASILNAEDKVLEIRQSRAQAQAQAQQAEQMAGGVNAVQQLGNAHLGNEKDPTVLGAMIGGMGTV